MAVHASGAKYALYVRKSNRHNWMLTLVAQDLSDLERCKRLDLKDFPDYQHAYLEIKSEYATLDDLPKNYPLIIAK